jgi:hypothetical protein
LEIHEVPDIACWPKLQPLRRWIEVDPAVVDGTVVFSRYRRAEVITRFGQ